MCKSASLSLQSLGCLLYALCFFKSPFEAAYERGDSVALAVLAGTVHVPDDSPYSQVTGVVSVWGYVADCNY